MCFLFLLLLLYLDFARILKLKHSKQLSVLLMSISELNFIFDFFHQVIGSQTGSQVGPKGDPGYPGSPGLKGERGPQGKCSQMIIKH